MGQKAPHCRTVPAGTVSVSPSASRAVAWLWVVAGLAGALGCGPESQGSDRTGAVCASEPPDPTSDRFFPDIPNIYDGDMKEPGLEVIAHPIRELHSENQYLVAVRNTTTYPICLLELSSTFTDFLGNVVAAGLTTLRTPLYHTTRQMGLSTLVLSNLSRCLGPGEIAMAKDTEILSGLYVGMIAAVRHDFSGFAQASVVPAEDVGLSGIRTTVGPTGFPVFSGRVENGSFGAIEAHSICVFAVNAAGRPIAVTEASGPGTVVVGDAVDFEVVGDFSDDFEDFWAYLDATSL